MHCTGELARKKGENTRRKPEPYNTYGGSQPARTELPQTRSSMSGFQAATAVAISGAFVYGMVLSLLGSIRPALAKRLGVSEERVGGLLTLLHVAFVPMVLISGPLADRMDIRLILVAGSILTALALYGLAIRNTFQMAMLSVLGVGLGAALLSTAS